MAYAGEKGDLPYPIIADEKRDLAVKLGMVDPDEKDAAGLPLTCRAVSVRVSVWSVSCVLVSGRRTFCWDRIAGSQNEEL